MRAHVYCTSRVLHCVLHAQLPIHHRYKEATTCALQAECPESKLENAEQLLATNAWDPLQQCTQNAKSNECKYSFWASQCNIAIAASSVLVGLTAAVSMMYAGT